LGYTLPGYLYKAFRTTGLTHIIVISGFNISLVSQAVILSSRRFLHRWVALRASLIAVGLFTIFVGPSPPVTRAALMGCVFIGGQLAGRRSHALTSLAFASLVMMICNPLLLWSVSFQLSFASTLALIVLEPFLVRHGYAWMERWAGSDRALRWTHIAESVLVATVAAQIATLPIIWHHFAEVSLLSLLANVLVLPVQPAIMLFGSIATALGALWQPAGQAAAWVVWPFLRYSIGVVELLTKWPLAALKVPRISATVVWAFYALVSVLLFSGDRPKVPAPAHGNGTKEQPLSIKVGLFVPALVALLIWAGASSLPDGKLHLYLLDVGQGDAILVRTPGGRTILVDGGPDPILLTSSLGPALPFWQRRIDLVVATHVDQDHLAGLVPVIERYRVPLALEPPRMDDCPLSARWHAVLAEAHTEVVQASRGMQIKLGKGLRLDVLHPRADVIDDTAFDDNENSLVLRVVMGHRTMLLTADIGEQGEGDLLASGLPVCADLLKVAHHGAASSSSAAFLAAVDPQIAVISMEADSRFGHPSEEVLARLSAADCRVFRTDRDGTIEFITDGQRCWVKLHR